MPDLLILETRVSELERSHNANTEFIAKKLAQQSIQLVSLDAKSDAIIYEIARLSARVDGIDTKIDAILEALKK